MLTLLAYAARHGRVVLVLGLLGGFALPGLAVAMTPWLPVMVAFLVFLSAARIGLRAAAGQMAEAPATLRTVLILQLAVPLGTIAVLWSLGWAGTAMGLAAVLVLAAPSISGGPTFTAMLGHAPEHAMRLLILGTALLPLTVLPVFWLSPAFGDAGAVIGAALRLTGVLILAIGAGFGLRRWLFRDPAPRVQEALDGASAITLGVIVIGLMSAVGPALRSDPVSLVPWLALVFTINFGAQVVARLCGADVGTSVVAGNRNVALFLVALPPEVIAPLLLFIGCYQIPMYLTPLIMKPFYDRA